MMLEKTLRYIVLAGIFALPFIVFIVAQSLFFPYITGKNFTFRIIVEIITGAWLALALVRTEYRPRKSWLLGAFAIFVIIVAIADANGMYPFKSFWSNYERMDGWVTLAHLFAYFVVASSILNTERLWRRFWFTSLGISALVGMYGLLQLAGISAIGQGGTGGLTSRLDATFGNPIYLAVFMLFNIFIGILLWTQSWSKRADGTRLPSSIAYGSVIALDTIVLFFTGTRGTMLGLIGGALLALMIYAFSRPRTESLRLRSIAVGTIVAVAILGVGLWTARDTAFVRSIGFLNRLASISLQDNTTKARFMNWGMAWQGVKERPLLGWGQENYAIVFDKYYDPQMYAQEQWFDRVHNIVFDWLVAAGFLGLLSYLSLFACALWCLWKKGLDRNVESAAGGADVRQSNSGTNEFSAIEASILTGLLAGYFFHNLFVFDNITSYILFASILAYIASRGSIAKNSTPLLSSRRLPNEALPFITLLTAIVVWGAVWIVNGKGLAQNRVLLQAIAPQQEGITKNLDYFKEAVEYGSFGTQEAREQLAQGAAQIAGNQNVPDTVRKQFFELAMREMSLQAEESPMGARAPLFLGVLQDAYGDYAGAQEALQRAHELSPRKQTILFEQGANAQARGDDAGALKIFKDAFDLAPDFKAARVYYASFAILAQKDALADELLTPLIESGKATDPRIAAAYAERGRYDKIVTIWSARTKAVPSDTQAFFTLAAALYAMGDARQAIEQLEYAARITPSAKAQTDVMIEQIKEGTAQAGQ
ncbi:hypothetical protein A3F27_02155 [Candidatus Kaiserbacteria bacterium RIFCSPHIGHO2_12_FULL_53_13]|uniref:O-antigen ligase-related domain-containing protein n=1 Tax=Candidatus Kaiserbacteria bacterium RIFCSPHIGHO2_12_FULL_53_13 TaxID=1798502 RepID=A0A1F6EBR2_9BACT|nr:MAG: hypothetical protein A3F27_02155 [Candidatus Kaiserbacteria bacterium RIFCSPHIGHO2_12_FULL_53_13]OGG74709.1 MAG: hypothetical protein A3A37_02495 [Candidatus Kaiserbacteria bacterium RIFCSPLOWO2_01_FULL_52_36]